MPVIIPQLNLLATVGGNVTTDLLDVSQFEHFRTMLYSSETCTLTIGWSMDGINIDSTDTVVVTAGNTTTASSPIRSKYIRMVYAPVPAPATIRAQHLFLSAPASLSSLANVGGGVELFKTTDNTIRTVTSTDGSVSLTQNADTINVGVTGGTVTVAGLNSDVQVAGAPSYTIGIGQGPERGTDSLYITGGDTTGYGGVGDFSVCIGTRIAELGFNNQGSVSIGHECNQYGGQNNTTSVGLRAGWSGQLEGAVAIGYHSGYITQGTSGTAVGTFAGYDTQGQLAVAVGSRAGYSFQGISAVAIGPFAGETTQGTQAVAIGNNAGETTQGANSVAVGYIAGRINQGAQSVAIGRQAGQNNQGGFSVAVGDSAAQAGQGTNSINIGYRCSYLAASPNNSVAIGANCVAPGAVGRLAFGNAMEAVSTTATAGAQTLPANPAGFIVMEWNGTAYKIPVYGM